MKSHLSLKHCYKGLNELKSEVVIDSVLDTPNDLSATAPQEVDDLTDELHDNIVVHNNLFRSEQDDSDADDLLSEQIDNEVFLKTLAVTICDWMHVKNIPYSTCNAIVKELFNTFRVARDQMKNKIKDILVSGGIEDIHAESILDEVEKQDPLDEAKEELESEHKRINFLKNTFNHVEPETIKLPTENGAPHESYQYIPLTHSLKLLLEDETFIKQKIEDSYYHEPGIIKDLRDGEYYRSNHFFEENPEAVGLIMFQV